MKSRINVMLAGTALALCITTPVRAQEESQRSTTAAPEATPPVDQSDANDIIVTANKFETRLQDTPVAVRAYEGEALSNAGVSDVSSLQRIVPELGVTNDNQYTKLAIRGVSSPDISVASDQAVSVNIDGEYLSRPVALNVAFFDVERIEVLRGPQGTLFGRNATAGAISIIAKKPRLGVTEGYASGEYGNFDSIRAEGALNVPLGGNVAFRLAGIHSQHDGFTDNRSMLNGQRQGGFSQNENVEAARAGLYGEFGRFSAYLGGEYVNIDQAGVAQLGVTLNAASPGLEQLPRPGAAWTNPLSYTVPSGFDLPGNVDRSRYPVANVGFLRSEQIAARARLEYAFDGATLSYIGGYRRIDQENFNELGQRQTAAGTIPTFQFPVARSDSDTQSHEVRLAGDGDARLVWQIGGFHFYDNSDTVSGLFGNQIAGGSFLSWRYLNVKSRSWAGYGQATYWIVPDRLGVTGGLRYTFDRKNGDFVNFGAQIGRGATPPARDDLTRPNRIVFQPEVEAERLNWLGRIEYKFDPDHMLYGQVTTGYKAGGFTFTNLYDPEDITAFEVGSRNSFDNGKLIFNVTGFYYDYSNQQVTVLRDFAFGNETLNVGASRYWGIETDFSVRLSRNDTFRGSVSYLDATFTQFPNFPLPTLAGAPARQPPVTADLDGNRAPQAPEVTIAVGYDKRIPIGAGELMLSANTIFKSEYFLTVLNWRGDRQEAFTRTDLSIDYTAPGKPFSIGAFVRNVENNRIKTFTGFAGPSTPDYNFIFGDPRRYGIRARVNF